MSFALASGEFAASKPSFLSADSACPPSSDAGNDFASIERWSDLQPVVDEAISRLPDELRLPIIWHYLEGETQQQVAERLDVDQATISRRVQRGLDELRGQLRKLGVMTTGVAIASVLTASTAQAAVSSTLTASVSKIALAGIGATTAKTSAFAGGVKPVFSLLAVVGLNVVVFLYKDGWFAPLLIVVEGYLFATRPRWFDEMTRSLMGRDFSVHPLSAFRRWTFRELPRDWTHC